jgi:hypothetical protein
MRIQGWHVRWVMLATLALTPAAFAQQQAEPMTGPLSQMINVPQLVENYARFLARKYNLDENQEKATIDILQKRTQEFLANHEEKIFELYNGMLQVRGGGDMSQEELIAWGKAAMPIYQDAKEIIIGGNAEWRQLLNDEQRAMHDEDVKLMHESFITTDEQLARIVTGEMTVEEFRNPPRANRRRRNVRTPDAQVAASPAQPGAGRAEVMDQSSAHPVNSPAAYDSGMPAGGVDDAGVEHEAYDREQEAQHIAEGGQEGRPGQPPQPGQQRGRRGGPAVANSEQFASEWERYVADFCKRHNLDDAQKQAAQKILRDVQDQANRYIAGKRPQIEMIDKQLAAAGAGGDAAAKSAKLRSERQQLLDPIQRMFEKQLKPRLDRIPTRAQRQAAETPAGRAPEFAPGRSPKPVK